MVTRSPKPNVTFLMTHKRDAARETSDTEREPLLINKPLKCPGPESLPNRSAKQETCPPNQVRPGGHAGQGGNGRQHGVGE